MSETIERTKVTMVYMGQRVMADGKRLYLWGELDKVPDNGAEVDSERIARYSSPIQKGAVPGQVYTFEAPANRPGTVFNNSGEAQEPWPNRAQAIEWVAADEAAKAQAARKSRAARLAKAELDHRLGPFQRAYHNANTRSERIAILSMVVNYITG